MVYNLKLSFYNIIEFRKISLKKYDGRLALARYHWCFKSGFNSLHSGSGPHSPV